MKLHPGEANIDKELVERLIGSQFPQFVDLPIRPIPSMGTVNAIYRLGDHLCIRIPRLQEGVDDLAKEMTWLPKLAPHVSVHIPEPVASGIPGSGYPFPWGVYKWIDGQVYSSVLVQNDIHVAEDLAQFVTELRRVDRCDAPQGGRRPLRELDSDTRKAIDASRGFVDPRMATACWETALNAPEWDGVPVWIHADLLTPNLLFSNGRLCAVIDFGAAGIGDPAADVIAAWSVLGPAGRAAFREALQVEDEVWNRARGYALHQALLIIPYYQQTNPTFAALAKRTVDEIISEATA